MENNTERTTPFPLGTTLYPQIETTVSAIKFARRPMRYRLRRKTAKSRKKDSIFVRLLGLIPRVFSHNRISGIQVVETRPFGTVGRFLALSQW